MEKKDKDIKKIEIEVKNTEMETVEKNKNGLKKIKKM